MIEPADEVGTVIMEQLHVIAPGIGVTAGGGFALIASRGRLADVDDHADLSVPVAKTALLRFAVGVGMRHADVQVEHVVGNIQLSHVHGIGAVVVVGPDPAVPVVLDGSVAPAVVPDRPDGGQLLGGRVGLVVDGRQVLVHILGLGIVKIVHPVHGDVLPEKGIRLLGPDGAGQHNAAQDESKKNGPVSQR